MKNSDFEKSSFLGMVAASVAHDLQNVLAIVKETAGLMQDNLFMYQGLLSPETAEKFAISISKVQKQVERGVDITSGLNQFAHTADSLEETIDVFEIVQRIIFLTQRIFQHKGMSIEIEECEEQLLIEAESLHFQRLVFKCLEYLGGAESDSAMLNISVENKTGINISVNHESYSVADFSEQKSRWQELCYISKQINATIKLSDEKTGIVLGF